MTALAIVALASAPAFADQVRDHEWWLKTLHVTRAWESSQGAGTVVALLDTGVDPAQPDLARSVISGPDFTTAGREPGGPFWGVHGTEMASLIAGHGHGTGNADGIVGIAPKAKVLSVRVTLDPGDPLLADPGVAGGLPQAIARGIRYAVRHGADVIDLPLDPVLTPGAPGSGGSQAEEQAVRFALARHVVLVAPAGDDGASLGTVNYPASYHGVISVGAFSKDFSKAPFSSLQSYVTLTAAGAGMLTAGPGGKYVKANSTSAASAVVSGVVALIRAQFPKLTVAQVTRALISGVGFRHPGGRADGSGYGTVDAAKALTAAAKIAETVPSQGASPSQQPAPAASPPSQPAASPAPNDHLGRTLVMDAAIAAAVFVGLLGLMLAFGSVRRRRARAARLSQIRAAATVPPQAAKKKAAANGPAPAAATRTGPPAGKDLLKLGSGAKSRRSQPPEAITLAPMSPPPAAPAAAAAFGLPPPATAKAGTGSVQEGGHVLPASAFTASRDTAGEHSVNVTGAGTVKAGTVRAAKVTGTPPWEPAPAPETDLPWTQRPPPGRTAPMGGEATEPTDTPPPAPLADAAPPTPLADPAPPAPLADVAPPMPPAQVTPATAPPRSPLAVPSAGPAGASFHTEPSQQSPEADTGSWEAVAAEVWPGGGPRSASPLPPAPSPAGAGQAAPDAGRSEAVWRLPMATGRPGSSQGGQPPPPARPGAGAGAGVPSPASGGPGNVPAPPRGRPPWELQASAGGDASAPAPARGTGASGTGRPAGPVEPPPAGGFSQTGATAGVTSPGAAGGTPAAGSAGKKARGRASDLPRRIPQSLSGIRHGPGVRPASSQFGSGPAEGTPSLFPPVPPPRASGPFSLLQAGESTETFAAVPSDMPKETPLPEQTGEGERTETFPAVSPDDPGER